RGSAARRPGPAGRSAPPGRPGDLTAPAAAQGKRKLHPICLAANVPGSFRYRPGAVSSRTGRNKPGVEDMPRASEEESERSDHAEEAFSASDVDGAGPDPARVYLNRIAQSQLLGREAEVALAK